MRKAQGPSTAESPVGLESILPGAEKAAKVEQLAEVVRVVVGDEEGLAQDGLSVAPGNFGEEIGLGVFDERPHGLEVASKLLDALVPGGSVGRRGGFRPVSGGPGRRDVFGIAAELEDVPLSETEVFEEHPGGVGKVGGLRTAKRGWKIFDDDVEGGVGVAAVQKIEEVPAQRLIVVGHWDFPRLIGFRRASGDAGFV